jgi:hypothetical protein
MSRLLLCVWLVGAAIYTASLLLAPSLYGYGLPTGLTGNETVRAKHPPAREVILPLTLPPQAAAKHRIEWVQAARYTAVVRAQPSVSSPVLFASTFGRPLRVIGRDKGFVKVQDLGTGQLGWIEARATAPFFGGYRQRETMPVMVAQSEAVPAAETAVTEIKQPVIDSKPRAVQAISPRVERIAARPAWDNGVYKKNRAGPQRIAFRRQGGIAGMMQRTLFGRL